MALIQQQCDFISASDIRQPLATNLTITTLQARNAMQRTITKPERKETVTFLQTAA